MTSESGPKEPSRPTVKRLFAVSGNRCAFPKCTTPLIDSSTGTVVGEICHICGDKPTAARYDATQTHEQRQSFDNLILLCNIHHKIVDDDETSYSVDRLRQMKRDHESHSSDSESIDEAVAERFVNCALHGSVIASHGQSGGQTAQVIHNYYGNQASDESIEIVGRLEFASGMELVQKTGCFGLQLTVICRSNRPARIRTAYLLVKGHGFAARFQEGFSGDFGYTPLEGEPETFVVELLRLTPPNSHEGSVLNRDDVCRFFYPLPLPSTLLALQAKAEDLSIAVQFFDGEERTLLGGAEIQPVLQLLYDMHRERAGELRRVVKMEIRAKSKTRPKADDIFKTNVRRVTLVPPESDPESQNPEQAKNSSILPDGLNALAATMLQAAQASGLIRETQTDQGGYLIRCGSQAFHNGDAVEGMARRRAELHEALQQLVIGRCIESIGGRGGTTYRLTSRAYELCDEITRQS